ncbi:MAG: esterase/lipase family protein [Betaproteobacteria bacterium]
MATRAHRIIRLILLSLLAAAGGAQAYTPYLFPSLYANGAQVDTAEIGSRKPLILIHGFTSDDGDWDPFLKFYAQDAELRAAVKPYSFLYDSTLAGVAADPNAPRSINQLGAALGAAMAVFYTRPAASPNYGFNNQPVVIVAHSMGGLVARSMMQEYSFPDGKRGGEKVARLITLGTPHRGTPLADAALANVAVAAQYTNGHPGFLQDMKWENHDSLYAAPSGHCNTWLAQLNAYAPAAAGNFGPCGAPTHNALPGYYDKIIAYGSDNIWTEGPLIGGNNGAPPVYNSLFLNTYNYLHGSGLSLAFDNDGAIPLPSALFIGGATMATHVTSVDHLGLLSNPLKGVPSCDFFTSTCVANYWALATFPDAPTYQLPPYGPTRQNIYNHSVFSGLGLDVRNAAAGVQVSTGVTGMLENPAPGSYQSGIGVISGWSCQGPVTLAFDGISVAVPYGGPRADTAAQCNGNSATGFGLLTNYNNLGAGTHTAQVFANGAPLGAAVHFTVTVPAGEFMRGLSRTVVVPDFPTPGRTTTLIWQESQQNFAIQSVVP